MQVSIKAERLVEGMMVYLTGDDQPRTLDKVVQAVPHDKANDADVTPFIYVLIFEDEVLAVTAYASEWITIDVSPIIAPKDV